LQNKKIQQFQKQLIDWYKVHRRPLPWRNTSDPYCIWVSEVMLQQTQVKTVGPYYKKFLHRFPDVRHLARAELQDVLKIWEGLGYYGRARNLHKAAEIIVDRYGGDLPYDIKLFRDLPGVGEYIASAVLSIAFGQPYAVVDGNVKRVLARLKKIPVPANGPGSGKIFKDAAERLLAKEVSGTFNQAMMELGSVVCTPRSPGCSTCPVKGFCQAFESNKVGQYPKRIKKSKIPLFHIATGVVQKGRKVLITRRKPQGLLGGLWEFPGGKVKNNETAEAACVREIKEEVNLKVQAEEHITRVRHAYTHFKIVMDVYRCRYLEGKIRLNGPVDFRWIRLRETDDYPFPGANHKFIPLLKEQLKDSV
jgi:A/G-specific adenine glycosylase